MSIDTLSTSGLGRVKTPGPAVRVEASRKIPHHVESKNSACRPFDHELENGIFYISRMYEFLHSQGHKRTSCPGQNLTLSALVQ